MKNNFVDIIVTTEESTTIPLTTILDTALDYKKINIIYDDTGNDVDTMEISEESELINFDIIDFSNKYVDKLEFSDKMKNLLKQKVQDLYNKVTKGEE